MVKQGYKQTEIGVITEDWDVKTIREVTEKLIGGGTPSRNIKEYWNGNIPWMTVKDFASFNENCTQEYITNIGLKNSATRIVKANNLIIATRIALGKIVKYKIDVAINQDLKTIELNKNINKDYFAYFYQSIENKIIEKGSGSTVLGLSIDDLYSFQIPLPPLAEQETIASALSDADAWIERLEQLIAKKRLIKQGAMQTLLTPPSHAEPVEAWEVKKLGDIGEVRMCKRVFQYQTSEIGEIPFFKIGTFGKEPDAFISRKHFEDFKQKFSYPRKGEVLISAAGTIGRTVVYDGSESYFQDSNIVWLENDEKLVLNKYLKYLLDNVSYNTEGGTIQRLYNSILKSTEFNCPSISEQERIATILSDMDAELEALETQLGKARQIKQGMMQELLTGRTRLV